MGRCSQHLDSDTSWAPLSLGTTAIWAPYASWRIAGLPTTGCDAAATSSWLALPLGRQYEMDTLTLYRKNLEVGRITAYPYQLEPSSSQPSCVGFFLLREHTEVECLVYCSDVDALLAWLGQDCSVPAPVPPMIELRFDETIGQSRLIVARIISDDFSIEYLLLVEAIGIGGSTSFMQQVISETSALEFAQYLKNVK